jgi:hypothetical protein
VAAALRAPPAVARLSDKSGIGTGIKKALSGQLAVCVRLASDRVELRFKDELRMAGIEGEWHVVPDGDSTELIELANSVDMAIIGQRAPRADGAACLRPDDVVMAAGRPVLRLSVMEACRIHTLTPVPHFEGDIAFGPDGEWSEARPIWAQYHDIKGRDVEQFREQATWIVFE